MKASKVILLCSLFLVSCSSYGKKQPDAKTNNIGFALVELFTSEGCSSCPAAEKALDEIHGQYKQNVYVLEFHVDYWNYLGWKDEFSSNEYTLRQQQYAKHFQLNSTYTPQAIVNGEHELVGSDKDKLHSLINDDLRQKPACIIKLSAKADNDAVSVNYTIINPDNEMLNIALVQKNAETDVRRGENSGRKLKHINIVRSLQTVDNVHTQGSVKMMMPQGLSTSDFVVIAFAQQKGTWKVDGAVEAGIIVQ